MTQQRDDEAGLSYKSSGVDIDAQDRALARMRRHVETTRTSGVLSGIGAFGGLFELPNDIERRVLVSSVDGVGTKVMVAQRAGRHDTIGHDLVNHCVNDILVMGAKPLFFLDYLAVGRLEPEVAEAIVSGVAAGCRENSCALIGGETAEMPDLYAPGAYDLAGTIVGVVSRDRILDGNAVRDGDALIGLESSGLHTNGYTLARKIVDQRLRLASEDEMPGCGVSVADALLAVHRSYLAPLSPLVENEAIHAMAHITGGGLIDNLPRALPDGLAAEAWLGSWPIPPLFVTLRDAGEIEARDMIRTFNLGIGMVLVVGRESVDEVGAQLARSGVGHWEIGKIGADGEGDGPRVRFSGEMA